MKKLFFILSLFAGTVSFAQPGVVDSTFGSNGMVLNTFNKATKGSALAVQPDGKIVAAGAVHGDTTKFCIARYLPGGSLDNSFGNGGKVLQSLSNFWDEISSILIQPDGKIIAGGWAFYGGLANDDYALIRYLPNGTPDPSFGTNGVVHTDVGGSGDRISAMALQPDGKIIAIGYSALPAAPYNDQLTAVRYMPNGAVDNTFGINGSIAGSAPSSGNMIGEAVALQPDGKILIASQYVVNGAPSFAVSRLTANGSPDATFANSSSGTALTQFGSYAQVSDMALQADGKIILFGTNSNSSTASFALTRFNNNGSLDISYGQGGHVLTLLEMSAYATACKLQPDGKLLATGYVEAQNSKGQAQLHFGLARYLVNGDRDSSFGNNGYVITAIGNTHAYPNAIALQADKKILLCGNTSDIAVNDMFSDGIAVVRYLDSLPTTTPPPAGIENAISAINNLTLFPNPLSTSATLQYQLRKAGDITLKLFDAKGTLVGVMAAGTPKAAGNHSDLLHFDSSLPAGNYILQLGNGSALRSVKVIIRR